jgi:hypothetical protein
MKRCLASHSKTRTGSRGPPFEQSLPNPKVECWLCEELDSSHGVHSKIAPPPSSTACPLPACLRKDEPSAWIATSRHVPLLSFLPTSAAYSTRYRVGLLHPTAGHGVRCVSGFGADPKICVNPFPTA